METLTLQKGAIQAPQIEEDIESRVVPPVGTELPVNEPAEHIQGTAGAAGATALDGAGVTPPRGEPPHHRYREDSSPEVITLLQEAQGGDTEAFAELYRRHVDRLQRYVSTRMWSKSEGRYEAHRQEAVADVVQDAFCEAYADLPNAHHNVTGWLLVHAAKAYIRYARADSQQGRAVQSAREAVRREYVHGHEWELPSGSSITAIGNLMLVHAISRLSPTEREVVQHRYLDGQTQKATAIITSKTLRAVKSAEHRARVKLREQLETTARPDR